MKKNPNSFSPEVLIAKALQFHSNGNFLEASKYYQLLIDKGLSNESVFCNYGALCQQFGYSYKAIELYQQAIKVNPNYAPSYANLGFLFQQNGRLSEAQALTRKAITLQDNFDNAHLNLGTILIDLGKLQEAEISIRKSLKINPYLARSYYLLSTLKTTSSSNKWKKRLFSRNILKKQDKKGLVDIYFARSNVLHIQKDYKSSSDSLNLANDIKLSIYPSESQALIKQSQRLLEESNGLEVSNNNQSMSSQSIFIVGMPRSGSTLIESIISMNPIVKDLGEINILANSYIEWKKSLSKPESQGLYEFYNKQLQNLNCKSLVHTNKWLYNYQFAGIIASQLPAAKIIHCYRNPLDNILSLYRAHFGTGNRYSSSLVDSAEMYLDQDMVMTQYKKYHPSKIFECDYDSLVINPQHEIQSMIKFLGWDWDDCYLSHHLNSRSVQTRSNIEVRSPINKKSVGGWKNYRELLEPAINLITKIDKFRNLID